MGARKFTEAFIDDAQRLFEGGMTLSEVSRYLACSADNLSKVFRARGVAVVRKYRAAHNAKPFPKDVCLKLYRQGASVKALSEKFGIPRQTITESIKRAGIRVRGRGAANVIRFLDASEELRKAQTKSANDAARGAKYDLAHLEALALKKARRVGACETELQRQFLDRGFDVEHQAAVSKYNLDLLINGTVAVELIKRSTGKKSRRAQYFERLEYLLNRGLRVLELHFRSDDEILGNLENIVSDVDLLSRNPSSLGQHRVVRCSSERFARFHDELGQFAAVPSPVRFTYTVREPYLR